MNKLLKCAKPVTQQEIIDELAILSKYAIGVSTNGIAERIKQYGIAPPDGWVLVPVDKLNEVHHWMLNAERVFKRDFSNHKFMGFDLMERTIDSISTMLAVAKDKP